LEGGGSYLLESTIGLPAFSWETRQNQDKLQSSW